MLEHLFSITYEVGSHSILSKDGALIDSGLPSCCKKIATWKIFGKKKNLYRHWAAIITELSVLREEKKMG